MRTGQNTAALIFIMVMAAASGCVDAIQSEEVDVRTSIVISSDSTVSEDVRIVEVDTVDAEVDECLDVIDPTHADWCNCQPQCCQSQTWFCPPIFGDPTVYSKEVIIDVCNNDQVPCVYSVDADCPPPEIILESDCFQAYECPPAADLDYGWQYCELPDGAIGKQQVICDKGHLHYSPCQGCTTEICDGVDNDCDSTIDEDIGVLDCQTECGPGISICVAGNEICFGPDPSEEICDNVDNDCDGEVDEFQLNVCGLCGITPQEVCNGVDDNCDGNTDEDLVQACSSDCGAGIEICSNGLWQGCTATQPSLEICDGLDNNCNQQVDEDLECLCTLADIGVLTPCAEPPLLCGQGFKTCACVDENCQQFTMTECYSICHWVSVPVGSDPACDSLAGIALTQEECNNFDDNCNQEIDENLISQCYTGPPGTVGTGVCLPGIMTCSLGVWGSDNNQGVFTPGYCIDEVVPQEEICDGADNDCDGIVDWGEEIPDTDILFIVDWSGSMDQEINAVLVALNQFAANYAAQDAIRWGLIVGPRKIGHPADENLQLISDISPFEIFLNKFASLGSAGMDTGAEMLLDAIYLALQNISFNAPIDLLLAHWHDGVGSIPEITEFNLDWRLGAERVIIVFTDEIEQSYLIPQITARGVITACQATPKSKVYTFSTNEDWDWDEIADNCDGQYFNLTSNPVDMYNSLMEILDGICSQGN